MREAFRLQNTTSSEFPNLAYGKLYIHIEKQGEEKKSFYLTQCSRGASLGAVKTLIYFSLPRSSEAPSERAPTITTKVGSLCHFPLSFLTPACLYPRFTSAAPRVCVCLRARVCVCEGESACMGSDRKPSLAQCGYRNQSSKQR